MSWDLDRRLEAIPSKIVLPLARAEDALARLDERLAKSPIREGWIARSHFTDAAAALWIEGELVHLEDLVLHDAGRDARHPTHELTRAHAILRTRRRIAGAKPNWALSAAGLDALRGRAVREQSGEYFGRGEGASNEDGSEDLPGGLPDSIADTDPLADAFAAVDAAIASANQVLAGEAGSRSEKRSRDPLAYDEDWDEEARLAEWRSIVERTSKLPPTLAAAVALEAWASISPLQHAPWLGPLLAAALLREQGKARHHLPGLQAGLKTIPYARRRPGNLADQLEAIAVAAEIGLKDHERWVTAKNLLGGRLVGRRASSKLPALVDYVMSRPLVSAGMIADELGITPRAAQVLVADLGLREMTGRGRYRAWGIL